MLGGDGSGHRLLALSALVVVLTICLPATRRASPGTQQPRCNKNKPDLATVSDGGYQLQGMLDDVRCLLSLICGFCGMHLLHMMQQGLVQRGALDWHSNSADRPSSEVAQDSENQDIKLCFSVGM